MQCPINLINQPVNHWLLLLQHTNHVMQAAAESGRLHPSAIRDRGCRWRTASRAAVTHEDSRSLCAQVQNDIEAAATRFDE